MLKRMANEEPKMICNYLIEEKNVNGLSFCKYYGGHVSINFCRSNRCRDKIVDEPETEKVKK